jgi:hypothetical protein
VVVVTASGAGVCVGLPLELDATPIAMAVITPTPIRTKPVVPMVWAWCTPAGLPAASGFALSAAQALEAAKLVAKASEIRLRIFPLGDLNFFSRLYTEMQQTQCAESVAHPPLATIYQGVALCAAGA